jgi:3-mercaptopyruvate sulfurtransferase SseA
MEALGGAFDVARLPGGFEAWQRAGLPTVPTLIASDDDPDDMLVSGAIPARNVKTAAMVFAARPSRTQSAAVAV